MVDTMCLELNLCTQRSKAEEANIMTALRHMRSGAGNKLASDVQDKCKGNHYLLETMQERISKEASLKCTQIHLPR